MDNKEKMEMASSGHSPSSSENKRTKSRRGGCASWFCNPVTFLIVLLISTILKATATGYSSGVLTSLEKRFQLKSTQIGLISMAEDIVGLFTVMIIVHYGQSKHRPRVIGVLTLIVAVGVFLQAMPHFLYQLPSALLKTVPSSVSRNVTDADSAADRLLCFDNEQDGDGFEQCSAEEEASAGSLMHEAFWIPLGSSVISLGSGIGAISLTYLDDNVPKRTMPIYAGIIFSVFAFGSLFGFFLASFCLQFPVTFLGSDSDYYSAQPGDANWLGAWWLGYIICSLILAVFGILFFLFPRELRDPEELARENEEYLKANPLPNRKPKADQEELKREASCVNGPMEFIKDFLNALLQISRNTVVMSLIIAGCLTAFSATGFMIFGPKFFSVVYELDPSMAALVMGAFLIPGAMTGQILGGVLINRFNLSRYGMAVMLIVTTALLMLGCAVFYTLRCDNRAVAGVTVPYPIANEVPYTANDMSMLALSPNNCYDNCGCPEGVHQPVCGEDGITYVTPCHAGCTDIVEINGTLVYTQCSCIVNADGSPGTANLHQCARPCSVWVFYIAVMIPSTLLGTMGGIAGFMLQLRSVDEHHRGLAMSCANVLVKILGYIPGPLIFGFVIEKSCLMYQALCGKTGNCVIYDSNSYLVGFNTVMVGAQSIGFICIIIAYLAVRRQTPKAMRGFRRVPSMEDDAIA